MFQGARHRAPLGGARSPPSLPPGRAPPGRWEVQRGLVLESRGEETEAETETETEAETEAETETEAEREAGSGAGAEG